MKSLVQRNLLMLISSVWVPLGLASCASSVDLNRKSWASAEHEIPVLKRSNASWMMAMM